MGKYWKLLLAFALYMYYYLTAELVFIDCIEMSFDKELGTVFYGLFCLVAAAGFFTFAPLRKIVVSTGSRRRALLGFGIAGAGCTLCMPFAGGWVAGALSLIAMFCAGHIGAALLYSMAVSVQEKSTFGMLIAIPYSAAFLLEYALGFVEPLFGDMLLTVTHITLAVAITLSAVLLLIYGSAAPMGNVPRLSTKTNAKTYLWGALISCLIIACLYGLLDGIIMNLHAGQELDVWGWVRLLCVPGMCLAGRIADHDGGRYFPFATLIAMLLAILAILLLSTAETYNVALGSVYFCGSFMTIYSLSVFVRVAADVDASGFWASAGRGVKYAAGGVFALLGSLMFERVGLIAIELLYLALLITLACVFYFRGRLAVTETLPTDETPSAPQTFSEMLAAYAITEREAETLRLLLAGKKTSDIATEMFVTEGTVYKYISAMITKTGTGNRTGLVALFSRTKS